MQAPVVSDEFKSQLKDALNGGFQKPKYYTVFLISNFNLSVPEVSLDLIIELFTTYENVTTIFHYCKTLTIFLFIVDYVERDDFEGVGVQEHRDS